MSAEAAVASSSSSRGEASMLSKVASVQCPGRGGDTLSCGAGTLYTAGRVSVSFVR